jgi:tetratricopeptide (TPR) repeat protein
MEWRAGILLLLKSFEEALQLFTIVRGIYIELKHELGSAWCTIKFGQLASDRGDYTTAIQQLQEAVQTFRLRNDGHAAMWCSGYIGITYLRRGDYNSAETELTLAWQRLEQLGAARNAATCRMSLGQLCRIQGDFTAA